MTDAELQAVFSGAPAGPCEREGDVVRAAAGEAEPHELPALLAHVRGCPACARTWADVRAAVGGDMPVEAPREPRPANAPWRWGWLGAAAVAAAVAVAVLAWPDTRRADWRAGGGADVVLGVPDGGLAADRVLRWAPVDGAYQYTVRVTSDDLTPLFEAVVQGTEVQLPVDLSGRTVLWQVVATHGDGHAQRSATRSARIP